MQTQARTEELSDGRRQRPCVVIVGAGFAGLSVARHLRRVAVDVVLVDQHNFHTFSPLLYQVATAGLEPEEIAQPVRRIVRDIPNLRFQIGKVHGIDLDRRRLSIDDRELSFDYLVLAAGSTTNYFGLADSAAHTLSLKDLAGATAIRNHVLSAFERAAGETDPLLRSRLMTAVIVGGGPTGVELAGALAELKRYVLAKDYPELPVAGEARVILLEAADTLLGAFPRRLGRSAADRLRHMDVDVRLGAQVAEVTEGGVLLAGGELIAAASVIWVAGVRAVALGHNLGLEETRSGRLPVRETLQLASWSNVFVAGDMASVRAADGSEYPMLAPVAIQQGRLVAENISRLLAHRSLDHFVYRDLGTMATIGRQAAVAKVGPLQLTGFIAWVMWLTVHLVWLIGFRNRLLVLTNWAWNYLFFERGASLIVDNEESKG